MWQCQMWYLALMGRTVKHLNSIFIRVTMMSIWLCQMSNFYIWCKKIFLLQWNTTLNEVSSMRLIQNFTSMDFLFNLLCNMEKLLKLSQDFDELGTNLTCIKFTMLTYAQINLLCSNLICIRLHISNEIWYQQKCVENRFVILFAFVPIDSKHPIYIYI